MSMVNRRAGDIAVVLERDAALRELNRRWRGIDRATDVLSFPYDSGEKPRGGGSSVPRGPARHGFAHAGPAPRVDGDLVISIDRVREQARRYRVTRGEEMARLVIHGTLHLAGHDHHDAAERRDMRALERAALRASSRHVATLERTLARAE